MQRRGEHRSPRRRSFYSCASSRALLHVGSLSLWDRQPSNASPLLLSPAGLASRRGPHTKTHLGLCPKTPSRSRCGWTRTMRKHRPYGTADTLSRCLRRILFGFCRPIAESYAAKTMGRTSNYLDRRPLPRHGGGERGCEAERRQWRMQRGGAPAAVEKIEQASSAKFFSGTARRRGQIRRGYLWSASVRSTDLFFPII